MTAPALDRPGWDVVDAAASGDADAFIALWEDNRHGVAGIIRKIVPDRRVVEDLVSDTFVRAWVSIGRTDNRGRAPFGWFATIGRNVALDYVKAPRRREVVVDVAAGFEGSPERYPTLAGRFSPWGDPDTADPAAYAMARDDVRTIAGYIDLLNQRQRDIIRLRFYVGLSIIQTANVVGISEAAVKAGQHRACQRLGTMMRRDGLLSVGAFTVRPVAA